MPTPTNFPRAKLPPTVWNKIEAEANARAAIGQSVIALHVGDTHLNFPRELSTPVFEEERLFGSRLNRYSNTFGDVALREIVLEKLQARNRLPVTGIDSIQITSGSTSGLEAAFSRLLDPGAEVLVPSPYWSILRQVADQARVKLVEVPFFNRMFGAGMDSRSRGGDKMDEWNDVTTSLPKDHDYGSERAQQAGSYAEPEKVFNPLETLERYFTSKTQGIYLNTPSNPTGMLLDRQMLARISEFAKKHDLWVFSDEAYEDFIWEGGEHVSIGSLPGMFERTVSLYTFSKCFGSSGIRCGYAVGEPSVISSINRGVVGSYYQPGRLGQLYSWRGMNRFDDTVAGLRREYESVWRWVRDNLKMEFMPSVGGFYFFIKIPSSWEGLSPEEKVDKMLDGGVALAPGEYFGHEYGSWARMCFTIVTPDQIEEAVHRLNRMFI